jgi:hypothetical protein
MYNTPISKREFHRSFSAYEDLIRLDQLAIWSNILGYPAHLEQKICNPLRLDKHPNCWLSYGTRKQGYIVLNDYARSMFHGFTVFDAVMYKNNCSFNEACSIIESWVHYGNISPSRQQAINREFTFRLLYEPHKHQGREVFLQKDKEYWDQYGISKKNLEQDGVKSVAKAFYNTKRHAYRMQILKPRGVMYAYNFGDRRKLYQPYGSPKFLSTCKAEDVWGRDSLEGKETIIITKSYKDFRVIKDTSSKHDCVGLQSETVYIGWDMLVKLEQYKRKIILFDNDATGKEQAVRLRDYCNHIGSNYESVWLDSDKDPATW